MPCGRKAPEGTRTLKSAGSVLPQTHTQCALTETWDKGGLLSLLHFKLVLAAKLNMSQEFSPKLLRQGGGIQNKPL